MPDSDSEKCSDEAEQVSVSSWISLGQQNSIEDFVRQSTSLPPTSTSASASETVLSAAPDPLTDEYQEDRYMFRSVGKRFRQHLKRFGELFSHKTPEISETERSTFELEQIPAEDFEDITRFIWSAFRVPFNVINPNDEHCHTVPVILSLLKVILKNVYVKGFSCVLG